MVTPRTPCLATSATVVSMVASRTARRWASIVSFQSLGTTPVYVVPGAIHQVLTETQCIVKLVTHERWSPWLSLPRTQALPAG